MKICVLTFFLICTSAFAQKEYNIWHFGHYTGIDFNSGKPVALINSGMDAPEGCASICDRRGNLLFYTNGETVYNMNHQVMLSGTGLHGNASSTQSAFIIRWPGHKDKYYIFTTDGQEHQNIYGLQYSIVDMALGLGKGSIITKNIPLLAPTAEKLTATYHSNKHDIWVITMTMRGDSLYAYLVTPSGVEAPVISPTGSTSNNVVGSMQTSPNGKKIAMTDLGDETVAGSSRMLLLDFDPSTGIASHPLRLTTNPPGGPYAYYGPYGLEFSPNSRLLYITFYSLGEIVYQFNLQAGTQNDIIASEIKITPGTVSTGELTGAIHLGPDGKIYIANASSTSVHVIHRPDSIGLACQFQARYVNLWNLCLLGLPNTLYSDFLPPVDLNARNLCFGDSTLFSLADTVGIDSVRWDFGDPISGSANTVMAFTPSHRFSAPGTYTVSAKFFSGVLSSSSNTIVTIHALPSVKISASCNGTSYSLQTQTADDIISYLWSTGEITADITVKETGTYWVQVSNGICSAIDTLEISSAGVTLQTGKDQSICPGGNILLSASGAETYRWTPKEGLDDPTSPTPLASPKVTTVYTVTGTTASGCHATGKITVVVQPSPALIVSKNQEMCIGKGVSLSVSGAKNYVWTPAESLDNPASPTPIASPKITTTYTVTGTNEFGCSTSAQVTVTVDPLPFLIINPDQTICVGTSVPLSVSGAATYLWTPAESLDNPTSPTPLATPTTTTVYTVTGTNEFGCSTSAQVTLTVSSQPAFTVSLGRDTVLCNQPQFLLKTGLTGAPHLWSTGETSEQITVTQSGNYWVAVGSDACAGRDSITVLFENLQLQAKAQKDIICQGESLRLEVSGAATYLWAPAESLDDPTSVTPLASPKKTTTYTVTGTGQYGCIVQQQLTIKVIESDHAQFSIDNASGNPGDIVTLPVYAQTDHALPDTLGTVHLELQTDAFAFEATGCSPGVLSQKIAADELTISIDLSGVILTRQRQVLTQIRGRVMSSYSSEVPIHVRQAHIQECEQKDRQDGTLYLTGCALRNRVVLRPISISITPNPVSEQAEIRVLSEEVGEHTITLYNVQGQKVWSQTFVQDGQQQSYTISVDHFPAGVYQAVLYSSSGTMTATMSVAH